MRIFLLSVATAVAAWAPVATARWMHDTAFNFSEVQWQAESKDLHAHNAFLGSPSVLRLAGGVLLASHDEFFLPDGGLPGTVYVFASVDEADSWQPAAAVTGVYWAQLFQAVNADVYLIGTSTDDGGFADISIARCAAPCNGSQWTPASVLFPGDSTVAYHAGPQPVVVANGSYYRAFEQRGSSIPNGNLAVVVVSASTTCTDLTQAACWKKSAPLLWSDDWINGTTAGRTWEEADAIVSGPHEQLHVMVRMDAPLHNCSDAASCNGAVLLDWDPTHFSLSFNSVVPLPSGCNKFTIRQHPSTGDFYSLTNVVTDFTAKDCGQRNQLLVTRSHDLVTWERCKIVVYDDTGLQPADSIRYTGFQYVMWGWNVDAAHPNRAEMLIRAGYRGSTSYHDANRMLYMPLEDIAAGCP